MLTLPPNINIASYSACTQGTTAATTGSSTTTNLMHLWHDSTNTKKIEIYRITASMSGGAGASAYATLRGTFTTTAGSGGTALTPAVFDSLDPASTLVSSTGLVEIGQSSSPTRTTPEVLCESFGVPAVAQQFTLFDILFAGKPLTLQPSVGRGFEIRLVNGGVAMSTATQVAVTMFWTETG